jgi:uridine kinase
MRAALLISGYLRTFKVNIPQIKSKILEKFQEVDIYIHITKNESKDDKYLNFTNEIEDLNYIQNILNPISLIFEDNFKYSDDKRINDLKNNWIKFYKLNKLKNISENLTGNKYDIVIKMRPDLNIISDNIFDQDINDNLIYIPKKSVIDKSKLINDFDEYICDIFAYGNSDIMNNYFNIVNDIDLLINKRGHVSENLLYHYLNDNKILYKECDINYNVILSLCNVFAIAGDSGSGKTTLGNILEKLFLNSFRLECDRYHKWERGNDNWKNFTHLNPEANYLTKMNDDIFDLKIGKTIHQVNYDHKNGKFTDKQKIEKSDNLIVCGLHSLYNENENLYNLKIFIDTDDNLKKRWKVKRDVEKRGYTLQKVMEQIEYRKQDYLNYIYPQREKSDIIINFFTDYIFDENNLESDINIYLRIYVHKKYSLIGILNQLSKNNISYQINTENSEIFNEVVFFEYIPLKHFNSNLVLNNYYDYIILFIMSLKIKF